MKKPIAYALLLATLFGACSEAPTDLAAGTTGAAVLNISGTRTPTAGEYDPLDHLAVSIYDGEERLLRRYASREDLPGRLELLRGDYRVAVEAGEQTGASFEKRHYQGSERFRVEAGATTPVEVLCTRTNVAAKASFEQSVADNFSQYHVRIAAADAVDDPAIAQDGVPALQFTADATGYFTLPEGVTTLAWRFEGEHNTRGPQTKSGKLAGLKAGDNCSLSFRFSPDVPGFIECFTITVDPNPDEEDDTIVWTEISIEGDGFDMDRTQDYIPGKSGPKSYKIANATPIASVKLEIDGVLHDLLNDAPEGVTFIQPDERHMTLTLDNAFFAHRAGGDHTLKIHVTDRNGGELERQSAYLLQGLLPIEKEDWDLWSKRLTLRTLVLDTDVREVTFSIRSAQGEQRAGGVRGDQGIFSAEFAPQWESSANTAGLTYHTPVPHTGIAPAASYTCTAHIGEARCEATLQTPAGDAIYNAGMDLWSTYTVTGSIATGGVVPFPNENSGTAFWVGGNNNQTNALCTGIETEGGNGRCAQLKPMVVAGVFAAGNLFTGTFDCGTGLLDMFGYARFGYQYTYTARPQGLRLRYKATIAKVTNTGESSLTTGDIDSARIYVCITDWTQRHAVKSGKSFDESTFWDPEKAASVGEGAILGYGSRMLGKSTAGWVTETIPIRWYDRDAAPAAGNYSLVISCVSSYKGDYVAGSTDNVLYAEEFEWVY